MYVEIDVLMKLIAPVSSAIFFFGSASAKLSDFRPFQNWLETSFSAGRFAKLIVVSEYLIACVLISVMHWPSSAMICYIGGVIAIITFSFARLWTGTTCRCFGQASRQGPMIMSFYIGALSLSAMYSLALAGKYVDFSNRSVAVAQFVAISASIAFSVAFLSGGIKLSTRAASAFAKSLVAEELRSLEVDGRLAILVASRGCEPCVLAVSDFEGFAAEFADRANFVVALQGPDGAGSHLGKVSVVSAGLEMRNLGFNIGGSPALLIVEDLSHKSGMLLFRGLSGVRSGLSYILDLPART